MGGLLKVGIYVCLASVLLSGCAVNSPNEPKLDSNSSDSASISNAAKFEGNLEDIPLPNLKENCAATEAQIMTIDLVDYRRVLDDFIEDSDIADGTYLRNLTWEQKVEGPSLIVARRILRDSDLPGVKNLESDSRNEFNLFVDIVLNRTLRDCGLESSYLERLEVLKEGRVVVQVDVSDILGSNPPLLTEEAGKPWKSYSEGIDWRWGGECERGFGSCKVVEVKTSVVCSSIYVEANFSSGGAITDSAIDSLRNLRPNQIGSFELVTTGSADSISLSAISCFG